MKNRLANIPAKIKLANKKNANVWLNALMDVLKMKSLQVNWNQHISTSYKEVNVFIAEYKTFKKRKFEQLQEYMKILVLDVLY